MGKNLVEQNMFWFSLQLLSETFLIVRRTEGDMIKHVYWSSTSYSCQVFNETRFVNGFSKNTQLSNFIKIRPAGAELSHAGGWTDRQTC
jgi:hypothetical protein